MGGLMQLVAYGAQDMLITGGTGNLYWQIHGAISIAKGERVLRLLEENPDHTREYLSEWLEHVLFYGQLEPRWISAMLRMAKIENDDYIGVYMIRGHQHTVAYTEVVIAWLLHHNPAELTSPQENWCPKTRETFRRLADQFVFVTMVAKCRRETRDFASMIARKTFSYF